MSSLRATTNFKDSNGTDLGTILVTKDYLLSVYPSLASELLDITPELWGWGFGLGLATGSNSSKITPVTTFSGGTNWKQVSCGNQHTAAIKTDGTLWVWGNNASGQLGTGDVINKLTPVTTFAGGTDWKQVSCTISLSGRISSIKSDGTLWIWGGNYYGQLGINNTTVIISTPVTTFAGGTDWKQCSGGDRHTITIKTDGTLWTWGTPTQGQLGINSLITTRPTPVTTFIGGTNWKQVSCGNQHTAAIKTDGTLWVWGSNGFAQLGTNDTLTKSIPVTTFSGGTNWKQVSCGDQHSAAIKTNGSLWSWGNGVYGRLGNNTSSGNRSTPVTTFVGGINWKQVSAGGRHSFAIRSINAI